MIYKLMIKTHNVTGLKYLCFTRKKDFIKYTGSGIRWLNHLKKNGFNFTTILIFETNDFDELKQKSIEYSIENNIINSDQWANLINEQGDGGDTVSNKKWITNGVIDKYIDKNELVPIGWNLGRSNCIFNNPIKQSEFSKRSSNLNRSKTLREAWEEGKFNNRKQRKIGIVKHNESTKQKLRMLALNRQKQYCEECKQWYKNIYVHKTKSKIHNACKKSK